MPSVNGGKELTGFSLRNLAVEDGALCDVVSLVVEGVLN